MKRTDLSVRLEKAILVGAIRRGAPRDDDEHPLDELTRLARTAGAIVLDTVVQYVNTIDPAYHIGSGKAQEVRDRVESAGANVVIFDNDLSPAQVRNLEKVIDTKVVDRTELILDIFASRAKTRQAKLQVELAQLEYAYPRLRLMWTHLSRLEGGVGIGGRGPGEKQLETDRRLVRKRIADLKAAAREIEHRKERQVRARKERDEYTISLVGYTNAGKSTLLNALTGAEAFVEDKLFATLDTKTRVWQLDRTRKALLSDTVGFVRDLPHHLVASFHATLEEAQQADLLLHVVDLGRHDVLRQVEAVEAVLEEVGCDGQPGLLVLNKADLLEDDVELAVLKGRYPDHVVVSALRGEGLDLVRSKVLEVMDRRRIEVRISSHCGNGKLLSFLASHAEVLEEEYEGERVHIRAAVDQQKLGSLKAIQAHGNVFEMSVTGAG